MNGIYIHVPFCRQKCHYCNFYSLASVKYRDEFLKAIIDEIALRKDYLGSDTIKSIYFGGGTPSLMSGSELNRVFEALSKHFNVARNAEITLEANPDDIELPFVKMLKETPVNRLSIGIQSFRDEDLLYLNRVHSARQAGEAIRLVQENGFNNLSIDLIFGIPTLTDGDWEFNLEKFISLNIPHLSAYALTVEPKTALDVLIRKGKMKGVDEEKIAWQFKQLMKAMHASGYTHYEISNYCKGEEYAEHNTNYWLGGKYLGLGPSAHSYNGESRQWNPSQLNTYIKGITDGAPEWEKEVLTPDQKYNEYIMVSLRTIWGVDPEFVGQQFGDRYKEYFLTGISKYVASNQAIMVEKKVVLTEKGKIYADGIASQLFWPD